MSIKEKAVKTNLVTLDHKLHSCSVVTVMWCASEHDPTIRIHFEAYVKKLNEHIQYMKKVSASHWTSSRFQPGSLPRILITTFSEA